MSVSPRIACLAALALLVSLAVPRSARAEARGQGVPVLAIDSEDADEQADALTNALRSHLRQTPGWTLMETNQSLSMLTAAFQCPQRPDAACLARIADKLKTDQFFWGIMSKTAGHQVATELHLWAKGKPDKVTRQTFSDNLKDANDDNLRKVATDLFAGLLGAATGHVNVHSSTDTGTVLVDGVASGTLVGGRATLTLAAGPHAIEVQSPGFASAKRQVVVDPSTPGQLEVVLEASGATAAPSEPGTPLPVRKIVGWTAIAAGAVLIGVGIGFGVAELNDQSDVNTQRQDNYQTGLRTPVTNPCSITGPMGAIMTVPATQACNDISASHTALAVEITTIAAGGVAAGVGLFLLLTDHGSSSPEPAAPPPPAATGLRSLKVLPAVGPGSGSMLVLGRF